MAEATAVKPNEGDAPSPRRPRRKHKINLCCAQSVQGIVEEVARNLQGLGFEVRVVCGAEARAALLDSRAESKQPTIHVVCVQGSLQERVLKPLRQALSAHGAENHHLLVAVLDLAVPLAMVGQIRRFAEALERPEPSAYSGAGTAEGRVERRSWREHGAHQDLDRNAARTVPQAVQVVERGSIDGGRDRPRRRTKSLTSRSRALKVSPTARYRAVTAGHPVVPVAEAVVHKRRRERSRSTGQSQRRPAPPPRGSDRVLSMPPPPPAPGEMTRRRSSTSISKPRTTAADSPEPDRVRPRDSPVLRFTPPAVKAAEVRRTRSGPFVSATANDGPEDADRTQVEALDAEISDTAATLRLDEPPFEAAPDDRTTRYGQAELQEEIAALEAKAEPSESSPDDARSESSADSSSSMVTPDPSDPSASTSGTVGPTHDDPEPPPRSAKTVLYYRGDQSKPPGEKEALADESSKTLVSESSRTLMRASKPGSSDEDDEVAESDKTLLRPDGTFEDARTLLLDVDPAETEVESETEARSETEPESKPEVEAEAEAETRPEADAVARPGVEQDSNDPEPPKKKTVLYAESLGTEAPDDSPPESEAAIESEARPAKPPSSSKTNPTPTTARPQTERAKPRATRKRGEARVPTPATESRSRLWLWLFLLLIGAAVIAYFAGIFDDLLGRRDSAAYTAELGSTSGGDITQTASSGSNSTSHATDSTGSDEGTTGGASTGSASDAPNPDPEPAATAVDEPKPSLTPDEETLAKAADERRITMLKTLFASKRQGQSTSWTGGNVRCAGLEVDGIGGWRLPHRREMKLLNAVTPLPAGIYWTRTVPKEDRQAAYVLDTATGGLSLFLKQEPTGEVICVRRREKPGK